MQLWKGRQHQEVAIIAGAENAPIKQPNKLSQISLYSAERKKVNPRREYNWFFQLNSSSMNRIHFLLNTSDMLPFQMPTKSFKNVMNDFKIKFKSVEGI